MCFQHVPTRNRMENSLSTYPSQPQQMIIYNKVSPSPAAIPHPTATKKAFSQKKLGTHLLHFPAPLPRLTLSFSHKVITGPWHRGKSPHPDRVLVQPAAAVHHDAHGADRPGLSRQGGPKHGICLVKQVVEKALATLTSNMITMETPLICTIQTWEDPGWVKFGLVYWAANESFSNQDGWSIALKILKYQAQQKMIDKITFFMAKPGGTFQIWAQNIPQHLPSKGPPLELHPATTPGAITHGIPRQVIIKGGVQQESLDRPQQRCRGSQGEKGDCQCLESTVQGWS